MKIFLDSSDINEIRKWESRIDGVTTNPTLMAKAGVKDYEKFAKEILGIVGDKPVSFEILADEFEEMERQARIINSWGENVYVKIPITNSRGESSFDLIKKLSQEKIKINITAVTNNDQVFNTREAISSLAIISIFSGRIADTGKDPTLVMYAAESLLTYNPVELLWASPREVLNIYQAEKAGADIITCTPELLEKYYKFKGMDLNELSLLTVKQFYEDGKKSELKL